MNIYVWLLAFCFSFISVRSQTCRKDARCRTSRISGMKAVDCRNKDMATFSQCLPSDVEIIDLSRNRIRKLSANDLKKYSYLKMLYLDDNMIMTIDEETFEENDYLQTLDLSLNGLSKVPPVLFHLPSLQVLYLRQNLNINIADAVEKAKPVTSPLFHLDISYLMTEEPNELPELGILPSLEKYNISGNKLESVALRHFASLCNLKSLDTTNVSIQWDQPCDCWTINRWLKKQKVNFKPFECVISDSECLDDLPFNDIAAFEKCRGILAENIKKSKMKTALYIVIPTAVVLLAVCVCYYIMRRRRQKMNQSGNKKDESQEVKLYNNAVYGKT